MSYLDIFSHLNSLQIFYVLLGGFLPALFWFWFWLREDRVHPEPRLMLILSFLGGMAAVIVSLTLEIYAAEKVAHLGLLAVILYVSIEEISKLIFASLTALRAKSDDEALDPLIYMIATALGFAALENTLFIMTTFADEGAIQGVAVGIMRFFGSTLLHVVSSAAIGAALGFSFYKKPRQKFVYITLGILSAIVLHTFFNLFIIGIEGEKVFVIFAGVWLSVLALILCFERLKKVRPAGFPPLP